MMEKFSTETLNLSQVSDLGIIFDKDSELQKIMN